MKKLNLLIISLFLFSFPSIIFALGDINDDGKMNIMDASLIRRYIDNQVELTENQIKNADINNDGNVDILDVYLLRSAISHIFEFDGSSPITNYLYCNGLLISKKDIVLELNENIALQFVSFDSAGRIDINSLDETITTVNNDKLWIDSETLTININAIKSGITQLKIDVNIATYEEEIIKRTFLINITVKNKVTYNFDNQEYIEYYAPNETVVFKTDISKQFYELTGYKYNNTYYSITDELIMPNFDIELIPIWKPIVPVITNESGFIAITNYLRTFNDNKEVSELDLKINNVYLTKVYDKNDNEKSTGLIGTFDKIKIFLDNTLVSEYIIILKGDVNGDGEITPLDYVKIKNHIMEETSIEEYEYLDAADYNSDDEISPLDYVKIKNYIMDGE